MAKYGQPVQLVNNILAFIWKRYKTNKKSFFSGIRLQQWSNFSVFLVLVSPGILLPLYFGASESIMGHYLLVLPTHPDPTTFLVTIPRHRTAESIFHIFFFIFKDTETTFLRPSKSLEIEMLHSVQWPRFSLNHVAETPARSS